jgi:hypothetical protein
MSRQSIAFAVLVDIVVDTISVRNLEWLDDRNRFRVLW